MELRGFDTYNISLGDEMRGERASIGKSLPDAERDLRLKATVIQAIENCDLSGFPNQSVVAGYVKSYARYLGMDANDCYERFCAESGFQSPAAIFGHSSEQRMQSASQGLTSGAGAGIAQSRFAAPPIQTRLRSPVSLGALTSSLALVALISALSYGGYALLKDIQRVGFAPLPAAPAVVANAPEIAEPEFDTTELVRPTADAYAGGGPLAAAAAPAPLPPIAMPRRDGPISALDPDNVGMFTLRTPQAPVMIRSADDAIRLSHGLDSAHTAPPGRETEPEPVPAPKGVMLHAAEDAWIRVREGDSTVIFEGILGAGEQFAVPIRVDAPVMKAGNAGGVYVVVDGIVYGPVGARGQVARNVSLLAEDVRAYMPKAEDTVSITLPPPLDVHQRAQVELRPE